MSFMGYAPADNPQIAIYVVIDRPNLENQSLGTKCAANIVREVLTEVLPYMGIFMTEELSEAERQELEAKKLADTIKYAPVSSGDAQDDQPYVPEDGTIPTWMTYEKDPATGCYIEPSTGALIDPDTGNYVSGEYGAIPE